MNNVENGWLYEDRMDHHVNHWDEDRSDELIMQFADDDMAVEAMKWWLRLWKGWDEDRLLELFEELSENKQCEILEEYIDSHDEVIAEFDDWWRMRYQSDMIDHAYDIFRDMNLDNEWRKAYDGMTVYKD